MRKREREVYLRNRGCVLFSKTPFQEITSDVAQSERTGPSLPFFP